ncbi:MAG: glycosyltransferase family 2 protein [bacterium]|nr:glycosyltransferase family 2 protein [bacterium]MDA1292319.1 glycosyltransferase family 2 protein [bacterium]
MRMKTQNKLHPVLTLVLPCYNEGEHFAGSMKNILNTLSLLNIACEIILIDDCSTDTTPDLLKVFQKESHTIPIYVIYHTKNQGRGATVEEGLQLAKGSIVGFMDIDCEVSPTYIPEALKVLQDDSVDFVLAQRLYSLQWYNIHRAIMTTLYHLLVRLILRIPSFDTEAGFKFFRRDSILPILAHTQDRHWFWDTEIVVRVYDAGLKIYNMPVRFKRNPNKTSTVRFMRDSWRSLKALLHFHRYREI